MEAFSFVKFWKSTRNPRRHGKPSLSVSSPSSNLLDSEKEDLGEGDDSFFELEISVLCTKDNRHGGKSAATPISVSPADQFPRNKVIPVMLESKPRSPVGPLRIPSKFRAFSFKMSKSTEKSIPCQSTLSSQKTASSLNLLNKNDTLSEDSLSSSSSKRFFSLIKPLLYPKGSKKQNNKENITSVNSLGQKVARKHLGNSRSSATSPAAVEAASPASRRDESLLVQHDGIQSAILHCKSSFHCSRESSLLSVSTSDSSSLEKLSSTSSEDSYEFSRIVSHSSTEKSVDGENKF